MEMSRRWRAILAWRARSEMHCITTDRNIFHVIALLNAKGELAGAFLLGGENVQADLLRADGIEVKNGRVDLKKYGFR